MLPSLIGIIASSGGAAAVGDYESIATVTVGAGGAATVSFSSISSSYKHLQIRAIAKTDRATYGDDYTAFRLNSDSGSNYSYHQLTGDGSSAAASGGGSQNYGFLPYGTAGAAGSSSFSGIVIDVLDYANTSKNKTVRCLAGTDVNGTVAGFGGTVSLSSCGWFSTSAIDSITIYAGSGNFVQYSSFALYGVK